MGEVVEGMMSTSFPPAASPKVGISPQNFLTSSFNTLAKMLARPYLMTLYVIFLIHLNFPIRSRCVLKGITYRKNGGLF